VHRQWLRWFQQPPSRLQGAETSATTQRGDLDEFIDNLDEILVPDLDREIEEESIFYVTLIRAASSFFGCDFDSRCVKLLRFGSDPF
jgi:hypothetical protein